MKFILLRLHIIHCVFLYETQAVYNKDVVCLVDMGQNPVCQAVASPSRRSIDVKYNLVPSHDPYIPRTHSVFYNCTTLICEPITLNSLMQITSPKLNLRSCYLDKPGQFECEVIRYNYFKSVDKLLFLTKNIPDKKFYLVDCLVYADSGRVCHKKDDVNSHAKLIDTGSMARPKESNILAQDEFLCEESKDKVVHCDIDAFVPFDKGLKLKESLKIGGDVLLKTGTYVVILKRNCIKSWCGYSGRVIPTRRTWFERYDPPGDSVYRCFYAKKQQVCKKLYGKNRGQKWLND